MNSYSIDGYKRVNKTIARKRYNNGDTIRICMNKVNPINDFYGFYTDINKADLKDFDKVINSYAYYNGCYELGYYTAFYVKEC